jgi:hypothetical protein
MKATAQVFEGAMVAQISGACCTGTTAASGACIGVAEHDQLGGATDGATRLSVWTDKMFIFKAGVAAPTDATPYGTVLFMEDDNSVGTGGSQTQIAGRFMGIEDDGRVRVYITNQASWFDAGAEPGELSPRPFFARAVFTTTAVASYTGTGTGVLTAGSNAALVAQDGVTLAVGDVVLLQGGTLGSLAITAADTGPYVVTSLGSASTKFVLTRPFWFANGAVCPTAVSVRVGSEGTLFPDVDWTSWAAPGAVIGTTDPQFYPDRTIQSVALVASTTTVTNTPIRSATKSSVTASFVVAGGTVTSTVNYGIITAPTAGYVGTASAVIDAIAANMGKNGSSDASTVCIIIENR